MPIKLIAIPSTFTGESQDRKLRVWRIALIARAAATFGITDIGVYFDPDPKFSSHGLGRYIVKILKYINTPPYLRKIAWPLEEDLREVGVAMPLKTPHHLDLYPRYRYAYVLRKKGRRLLVTDSFEKFWVKIEEGYRPGETIVVVDKIERKTIDKRNLPFYFGYDPFYYPKGLKALLENLRKRGFLIIGTSKYGEDIREVEVERRSKVAVIFGSFARGLRDMLGKDWERFFDIIVNVVPGQWVETIRMEEAVFYVLEALRIKNVL